MKSLALILLSFASIASAQRVSVRQAGRALPVDARVGEEVTLDVYVGRHRLPAGASVRWYRIVPHLQYADATDTRRRRTYTNAVLGGVNHRQWVGVVPVEYYRVPFENDEWTELRGEQLILRGAPAKNERVPARRTPSAGTLWVTAEVTLPGGQPLRAPGIAEAEPIGLGASVMRVSFRDGDDLLGWFSAFAGIPYVFGSTGRQSNRRTGIDCADAVIAAANQTRRHQLSYTSVPGLPRYARPRSEVLRLSSDGSVRDEFGRRVELRWQHDVRAGDFIMIDYSNGAASRWRHVGVLLEDAREGATGVFDGTDIVRHMGRRGLSDDPISRHGQIRFQVWRLR